MSRDWPWSVLELDATADERDIRRAYARQLKLHRPDRDPQGFQQLRAALEEALQSCHFAALYGVEEEADATDDERPRTSAEDALITQWPSAPQPAADPATVPLPRPPALDRLVALLQVPPAEEGEDAEVDADAVAACLADLLQDPRLTLPGVRQQIAHSLLTMLATQAAGYLLWPQASAFFAWDVDDPAFAAAWPQVVDVVQQQRLAQWAEALVLACQQDAATGLQQLQALLESDALLSIDLRLAFYRQLATSLCSHGGVEADTFAALCPLLGWQANGFCPRELYEFQWRSLLHQVAIRDSQRRDQVQWQRLQGIASGQVVVRWMERRAVRALLAPSAPSAFAGLWPGLTEAVRQLLTQLTTSHPDLLARLAPSTLDFWQARALAVPGGRSLGSIIFWLATAGFSSSFAAQPVALFIWLTVVFAYLLWLDPQLDLLLQASEQSQRWLQRWRYAVAAVLLGLPSFKLLRLLLPLLGEYFLRLGWLLFGASVIVLIRAARNERYVQWKARWRLALAIHGPLGLLRRCMLRPSWDGFEWMSMVLGLGIACVYGLLIGCSYLL